MTTPHSATATGADRLWQSQVGGDIAFLLARANAQSLARVNGTLQPFDLTVRSFAVLSLATEQARLSQRDLAEFLRLDPSQIVSLVDGLEKAGLVRREPDPSDRRAKLIVATAAGHALHTRARAATTAAEAEASAAFTPAELAQFVAALRRVAQVDGQG